MYRKQSAIYKSLLLIFFLTSVSAAVLFSSSGTGGSSFGGNYEIDTDTDLTQKLTLGDGWISSSMLVEGNGNNKIDLTASNKEASASSSISCIGALSSTASSYASKDAVNMGQNIQSSGQSDCSVSGASGSVSTAQNAGVLDGYMTSSQTITAGSGKINSLQFTDIAGTMGYTDGKAQSYNDIVHLTGGLNGVGGLSGFLEVAASDGARASGSFQAESLESKAYSAIKSTSAEADAYSYLSSEGKLESSLSGSANGHVTSNQQVDANGDVKAYASSSSDDSSSESYDVEGDSATGSMSASAGSAASIDADLQGDLQNPATSFIPTPGSWVWNGFGGILTSNPYQLVADGQRHIFAKGGENALWDNVDGDWQSLGGQIDSDPFALQDAQGNIHILVKGADRALWDRIYDGDWYHLGGVIDSNPSAAFEPGEDGYMYIVVRGYGDNSLWARELNTVDMTGDWYACGGSIISNPQIVFDSNGNWHTFARGGDNALYDLYLEKKDDHFYEGDWHYLGGSIASDAMPALDPYNTNLIYTSVRGSDNTLQYNTLDINTYVSTWTGLGGVIEGTPSAVVDTDGVLHNFARGADQALWDNAGGTWYCLGGLIKSNPNAIRDKEGKLQVAAIGVDNALYSNTIGVGATPITLVGSFACDFDKIQSAVDSISEGGTVKVLEGNYNENVKIDKSLTVQGAGEDKTIVNGQLSGSVFTIGLYNPSAVVSLKDMTFENGNAQKGGGIYNRGTLSLNGITLTDNTASNGGGIFNDGGTVSLNDVIITDNAASNGGGLFSTNSHVTFDGTQILVTNNRARQPSPDELSWYQGWGVYLNSGAPTTTGGFDPVTQVTGNIHVTATSSF